MSTVKRITLRSIESELKAIVSTIEDKEASNLFDTEWKGLLERLLLVFTTVKASKFSAASISKIVNEMTTTTKKIISLFGDRLGSPSVRFLLEQLAKILSEENLTVHHFTLLAIVRDALFLNYEAAFTAILWRRFLKICVCVISSGQNAPDIEKNIVSICDIVAFLVTYPRMHLADYLEDFHIFFKAFFSNHRSSSPLSTVLSSALQVIYECFANSFKNTLLLITEIQHFIPDILKSSRKEFKRDELCLLSIILSQARNEDDIPKATVDYSIKVFRADLEFFFLSDSTAFHLRSERLRFITKGSAKKYWAVIGTDFQYISQDDNDINVWLWLQTIADLIVFRQQHKFSQQEGSKRQKISGVSDPLTEFFSSKKENNIENLVSIQLLLFLAHKSYKFSREISAHIEVFCEKFGHYSLEQQYWILLMLSAMIQRGEISFEMIFRWLPGFIRRNSNRKLLPAQVAVLAACGISDEYKAECVKLSLVLIKTHGIFNDSIPILLERFISSGLLDSFTVLNHLCEQFPMLLDAEMIDFKPESVHALVFLIQKIFGKNNELICVCRRQPKDVISFSENILVAKRLQETLGLISKLSCEVGEKPGDIFEDTPTISANKRSKLVQKFLDFMNNENFHSMLKHLDQPKLFYLLTSVVTFMEFCSVKQETNFEQKKALIEQEILSSIAEKTLEVEPSIFYSPTLCLCCSIDKVEGTTPTSELAKKFDPQISQHCRDYLLSELCSMNEGIEQRKIGESFGGDAKKVLKVQQEFLDYKNMEQAGSLRKFPGYLVSTCSSTEWLGKLPFLMKIAHVPFASMLIKVLADMSLSKNEENIVAEQLEKLVQMNHQSRWIKASICELSQLLAKTPENELLEMSASCYNWMILLFDGGFFSWPMTHTLGNWLVSLTQRNAFKGMLNHEDNLIKLYQSKEYRVRQYAVYITQFLLQNQIVSNDFIIKVFEELKSQPNTEEYLATSLPIIAAIFKSHDSSRLLALSAATIVTLKLGENVELAGRYLAEFRSDVKMNEETFTSYIEQFSFNKWILDGNSIPQFPFKLFGMASYWAFVESKIADILPFLLYYDTLDGVEKQLESLDINMNSASGENFAKIAAYALAGSKNHNFLDKCLETSGGEGFVRLLSSEIGNIISYILGLLGSPLIFARAEYLLSSVKCDEFASVPEYPAIQVQNLKLVLKNLCQKLNPGSKAFTEKQKVTILHAIAGKIQSEISENETCHNLSIYIQMIAYTDDGKHSSYLKKHILHTITITAAKNSNILLACIEILRKLYTKFASKVDNSFVLEYLMLPLYSIGLEKEDVKEYLKFILQNRNWGDSNDSFLLRLFQSVCYDQPLSSLSGTSEKVRQDFQDILLSEKLPEAALCLALRILQRSLNLWASESSRMLLLNAMLRFVHKTRISNEELQVELARCIGRLYLKTKSRYIFDLSSYEFAENPYIYILYQLYSRLFHKDLKLISYVEKALKQFLLHPALDPSKIQFIREDIKVFTDQGKQKMPPKNVTPIPLHLDDNKIWNSEGQEFATWIKGLASRLCQATGYIPFVSLAEIVGLDSDLAVALFPILIHVLLEQNFVLNRKVQRILSLRFNEFFLRYERQIPEAIEIFISAICYLRNKKFPSGATVLDCNGWLKVDFSYLARAAAHIGLHLASLQFLEVGSELENVHILGNDVYLDLYTEVFRAIGDVDSMHGIADCTSRNFGLELLEMEGKWKKILDLSQGTHNVSSSRIHNSLIRNGYFDLSVIPKSFESLSTELKVNQYEAAWRLSNWDLPICNTNSIHENLYTILKDSNSIEVVPMVLQDAFENLSLSMESGNLKLHQNLHEIAVYHNLELALDPAMANNEYLDYWHFEFAEPMLCAEICLYKGRLEAESSKSAASLVDLCRNYLEYVMKQENRIPYATRALSHLRKLHSDFGIPSELELQLYNAKIMWKLNERNNAINSLKSLMQQNPKSSKDLGRVMLQLAEWQAVEKNEGFESIKKMLEDSSKMLEGTKYASDAYYIAAKYSDDQFRIYDIITKDERLIKIHNHKQQEYEDIKEDIEKCQSNQEKRILDNKMRKILIQVEQDKSEDQQNNVIRGESLERAMSGYIKCLEITDKYDWVVHRLCDLWLGNMDSNIVNDIMKLPSVYHNCHKFIPLIDQLSARLENVENRFQETLKALIHKMGVRHPFHTMYQLISIAFGRKTEDACKSSKVSFEYTPREAAAKSLVELVANEASCVNEMCVLSEAYIEFACTPVRKAKNQTTYVISNDLLLMQLKLDKLNLPMITADIPINPKGDYGDVPRMREISKEFQLVGGINNPKLISCKTSDGQQHRQLVKSNDDLHQDAIMMQMFTEVNQLLEDDNLIMPTYKVVPLSPRSGVLQWIENVQPIRDYLTKAHKAYRPQDMSHDKCWELMGNLYKYKEKNQVIFLKRFQEIQQKFKPVFRHFFLEYLTPCKIYERRIEYIKSVAVSSILGYIVELADRHSANVLISRSTGQVVHIDLGIAFGQGSLLNTPEKVPFRLTRDIVDGMGVTGTEGLFRRTCIRVMEVLKEHKDRLMSIFSILQHNPLHYWADIAEAERVLARIENKLANQLSARGQVAEVILIAKDEKNLALMYPGKHLKINMQVGKPGCN